ncbi:MAG: alanine racemase [Planctomycetes bacterium]|nr:alanine racemase [Planctomycetota bacterium]
MTMPLLDSGQWPTPFLRVDLVKLHTNLERMGSALGGDWSRWQPHLKTTKTPSLWRPLLEQGVRRFKCATLREAELLLEVAAQEIVDIELLIAIQLQGANLQAARTLAKAHPHQDVSVLTEDSTHAEQLAEHGLLGAWVDLDPGDHRSGIPVAEEQRVVATVRACGSAFRGLHHYEGGVRDSCPKKRMALCKPLFRDLRQLIDHLAEQGLPIKRLITSGTPTFQAALQSTQFSDLDHRVSPGTTLLFDLTSQGFGLEGFAYAACVQATVISRPTEDHFTVDAGSKTVDAACNDPVALVVGHPEWVAQRPSEEHLPFLAPGNAPPLGTILHLIPRHVCPTVNLAENFVLIQPDGQLSIETNRGRAHSIQPVPIGNKSEV